jgi:ribonuclease HII
MDRMPKYAALQARPRWAGVDEAGRGPLAGPVVAAAVLLPESFTLPGLTDSKQMSKSARDRAAMRIKAECKWSIVEATVAEIDEENILNATLSAMKRAVEALVVEPDGALIDGNRPPSGLKIPVECAVKGDAKFLQIAAASVLAKTHRDALMIELAAKYPMYGFDRHYGYPTPEHLTALKKHGPCPAHRTSFAPVKNVIEQPCLDFVG